MDRREFIKYSSLMLISSLLPFGFNGWAAGMPAASPLENATRKKLIVLFQRGAVDGLSLVIPFTENNYHDFRPTISIPTPGSALGSLELNDTFALNPNLSALMPLWKDKTLAFLQACGSPNPSRSHFDAQEYMENGTPGDKNTKDGWMNRLLAVLGFTKGTTHAISIGSNIPLILQGKMDVINITAVGNPSNPTATDVPIVAEEFAQLYKDNPELGDVLRQGLTERKKLLIDLKEERIVADHGAPQPSGFVENCSRLAKVIGKDPTLQIAFLDVGGWDTHINQGGSTGQLANHLKQFGQGVNEIVRGLGDAYKQTMIVVVSEFGRTARENGHFGTDHGHGNVMWALGGAIQGGKVYGRWPGLSTSELHEDRDLQVTTDFRHFLGYLLGKHFNLSSDSIGMVFPNTPPVPPESFASFRNILI